MLLPSIIISFMGLISFQAPHGETAADGGLKSVGKPCAFLVNGVRENAPFIGGVFGVVIFKEHSIGRKLAQYFYFARLM